MSFAIQVQKLVKRFGDFTAVNGLDLEVESGICLGLLGPNGAGKTTTLEIIEGLQDASSGTVRVLGKTWEKDATYLRTRVGIQLQETHFADRLTVEETVRLYRSFYPSGLTIEEAIALVKLEEKRGALVMNLSGGQRQRLALAVALVSDPELVFLDEPTTGLDPQSRRALWDVVEALKQRGRTIVLTTHYMEEAERLCDRIVVIDRGATIADGSPAELTALVGGDQIIELATEPPLPPVLLANVAGVVDLRPSGNHLTISVRELRISVPAVLEAVARSGARIEQLSTRRPTLDDVFLSLTGRSLREAA